MSGRNSEADVSVVIPSYNSRDTILDCLRALLEGQETPPREVIVVDSSSDGTADLIERTYPQVDVVRLERKTHAGIGRNIGARKARGSVIAFTDADCLPAPDWIENVRRLQNGRDEGQPAPIIAGAIGNGTPRSLVGTADWFIEFSNALPGLPAHDVPFAATANLSLPRSVFLETRGFDDSPTGQDMVFGRTLRDRGFRIRYDGRPRVAHRNRQELRPFLRRQYALGRGSALIRRRIALRGAWIVRFPPLIPALFPYRLLQIVRRSLRADVRHAGRLVKASPIILLGVAAWVAGFFRGAVARPTPRAGRSR